VDREADALAFVIGERAGTPRHGGKPSRAATDFIRWSTERVAMRCSSAHLLTIAFWTGTILLMLALLMFALGTSQTAPSCVQFASGRILVGHSYVAPLQGNLDFVLGDNRNGGWTINVMPRFNHTVDYVEVASPPFQVRRHLEIGKGDLSVPELLVFNPRVLHFVTNEVDRERAAAAIIAMQQGAAQNLDLLERLPRGTLTVTITAYSLRDENTFDEIRVAGESCLPG
jgi:hypothetical protein